MSYQFKTWVGKFVEDAMRDPRAPLSPKPKKIPTCGGVYFIQLKNNPNGPVKIGRASNIRARFSALQVGHPQDLKLLGYLPIADDAEREAKEIELHERFKTLRMRGEWFDVKILQHVSFSDE